MLNDALYPDKKKAAAYVNERKIDKAHFYEELDVFATGATAQRLDGQKQDYTFFYNRTLSATPSKIVSVANQMTSKENNVLNDFIEAQTYYQASKITLIKRLARFYSFLYLSSTRKNVLLSGRYDDFLNIQRYRKIYELSRRKHMILGFAQKAKQFLQNPFSFFSKNR